MKRVYCIQEENRTAYFGHNVAIELLSHEIEQLSTEHCPDKFVRKRLKKVLSALRKNKRLLPKPVIITEKQALVILCRLNNVPYKHIAKTMEIAPTTVRNHELRCVSSLRKISSGSVISLRSID